MRCLKHGHVCTRSERSCAFIQNLVEDNKIPLRWREPGRRKTVKADDASTLAEVDPDIPQFNVNFGVRNLFVAKLIEGFALDVLARDGNGVLFCACRILFVSLLETVQSLIRLSWLHAQCSWPSETMISSCSSICRTNILRTLADFSWEDPLEA